MFQCYIYHVSITTRDRLQCAQDITASLFKILKVACNMVHQNNFRFCMSAYQIPKQTGHLSQHIYWKDILHLDLSKSWKGFYTLVIQNNDNNHNTNKDALSWTIRKQWQMIYVLFTPNGKNLTTSACSSPVTSTIRSK